MPSRIKHWLTFRLERIGMHGAPARFAIILGPVLAVAVLGGLLARAVGPGFESMSLS